ncbi:hypothetical protein BN1356_02556 [Streptococcus varani]|uniref:Uncharacterized protein n=1 Tax=Streptococcus varani TaxID=1608583 RepID=A0A0E4H9M6_9STRE|nr:hypothetical protein [Streptococcus varani]CQR26199.1 hypothetical protein BN1356_02556 [Streptococcus varani]
MKFKKLITLFLVVLTLGSVSLSSFSSVKVFANQKESVSQVDYTVQEQELTNALEFMFNNAVTYDSNGYVKDINFDVIYAKYGVTPELQQLEKTIFYEKTLRASAGHCAVVAIQDTLGVSAVTGLINGGIVGLLQRKASAEIAKLVAKYAFKNLVPVAVAASLIWSFGRCMWF